MTGTLAKNDWLYMLNDEPRRHHLKLKDNKVFVIYNT